ncbi:MAG: glycosyltransferase family 39 protein, partial [Actinomycetota bacterium]
QTMPNFRKHPDFWFCTLLTVGTFGLTLPFLNHAFHIYEPLFLSVAKHIQYQPLNPYGFKYLWHIDYQPMFEILDFPPLFPYYLSLVFNGKTFPSELLVHGSLIPFALLAVLSLYALIRQVGQTPLLAFLGSLIFLVSPIFVIMANLAIPDLFAVSLFLLSLVLLIRGWKNNQGSSLLLGGLVLGAACLTRYNALPLLPFVFLLGLTYTSKSKACIPVLIALTLFSAWVLLFLHNYQTDFIFKILSPHFAIKDVLRDFWSTNIHLTLMGVVPILLLPLLLRKSPFWLILCVLIAGCLGLLIGGTNYIPRFAFFPDAIFFSLGITAILFLLFSVLKPIRDSKIISLSGQTANGKFQGAFNLGPLSPESKIALRKFLLFVWFASTLFLPFYFSLFPSKYLLMSLPPFILIFILYLSQRSKIYTLSLLAVVPLFAIFSFTLAKSDFALAEVYRQQARRITNAANTSKGDAWFTGHWGWQFYMENLGAYPIWVDSIKKNSGPFVGDWVITPQTNSPQPIQSPLNRKLIKVSTFSSRSD